MVKLLIYSDLHLENSGFEPDADAVAAADVVELSLLLLEPQAESTSAPAAVAAISASRRLRRGLSFKITPSETLTRNPGRVPPHYCIRGILPRSRYRSLETTSGYLQMHAASHRGGSRCQDVCE